MMNANQKELLNGIKSYVDLKTDGEEGLVWADEFENGQWDGTKWFHNCYNIDEPPYVWNPYHRVYDEELGRIVMELNTDLKGGDSHERLMTRQAFRDVTIEMKCKNGSFWVGSLPYFNYAINNLNGSEPFMGFEADMAEVYLTTNGWKTLNNNLHIEHIGTNMVKSVSSTYRPKTVTADFWNKWHTWKMVIRDNLYEETPQDSMTIQWWCDGTKMGETVYDTSNYLDGSEYAKKKEPVRRMGFNLIICGCNTAAKGGEDNQRVISEQPRFAYVKVYSNHLNSAPKATSYTKIDNSGKEYPIINCDRTVDINYSNWNTMANMCLDYLKSQIPNFKEEDLLSLPEDTWSQMTQLLDSVIDKKYTLTADFKKYILKSIMGMYRGIGATTVAKQPIARMSLNLGGVFKAYPLESNVIDTPELIINPLLWKPSSDDAMMVAGGYPMTELGNSEYGQMVNGYVFLTGYYKFGRESLISFMLPVKTSQDLSQMLQN